MPPTACLQTRGFDFGPLSLNQRDRARVGAVIGRGSRTVACGVQWQLLARKLQYLPQEWQFRTPMTTVPVGASAVLTLSGLLRAS